MINSFSEKYFFLSNFYNAYVMYDNVVYCSTEAAFQAAKTMDTDLRVQIAKMSPSDAKKAGRNLKLRPDWEEVKDKVMYDVCYAKFTQNGSLNLRKRLLETGNKELVEGNTWHDNYWGNCTCDKCKDIPGRNQLGKTLMKIRDDLKIIKHVKGDIFESGADVICHQVNCQGVMGSGIAKQVKERYPNVYEAYKELCLKDIPKNLLGIAQPVQADEKTIVVNIFAQENFGYDGECYTDYDALRRGLETIRDNNKNDSIAIPYLMGCHRGGGDWGKVYAMIDEVLAGCNVTLYEYNKG